MPLKTIIHSGPGPTYKGVVRSLTDRLFETDWLPDKAYVRALCDRFKATHQEPVYSAVSRQKDWDF